MCNHHITMSLTSQLKDPNSPMGSLMVEHFNHGTDWADRYHEALQSAQTSRPLAPAGARYDYPLIGTALTYLLPWEMEPKRSWLLEELSVPYQGFHLWRTLAFNEDLWTHTHRLRSSSARPQAGGESGLALLRDLTAATARLPKADPEEKCRLALFLGMLDHWFRSRAKAHERMYSTTATDGLDDILRRLKPEWVEDLMTLRGKFQESLPAGPTGKNVYFPTFAGSAAVGGADADWITGKALIDCKATIRPLMTTSELRQHVWQLLGYAALDWDNEFKIKDVGLYMARQGTWVVWNGDDLCRQTSEWEVTSLEELRELTEELLTDIDYGLNDELEDQLAYQ